VLVAEIGDGHVLDQGAAKNSDLVSGRVVLAELSHRRNSCRALRQLGDGVSPFPVEAKQDCQYAARSGEGSLLAGRHPVSGGQRADGPGFLHTAPAQCAVVLMNARQPPPARRTPSPTPPCRRNRGSTTARRRARPADFNQGPPCWRSSPCRRPSGNELVGRTLPECHPVKADLMLSLGVKAGCRPRLRSSGMTSVSRRPTRRDGYAPVTRRSLAPGPR